MCTGSEVPLTGQGFSSGRAEDDIDMTVLVG
jgi:hypothetical protein